AIEHADSPALGRDAGVLAGAGESGVPVRADADAEFDVMVEFTTPAATLEHVEICRRLRRAIVIGTTGLDAQAEARVVEAARDIPLILAANTSVGVNLCLALAETAASAIGALTDIEIVEAHHRDKVDAPSGTALALGRAVAAPLGKHLDRDGVFARHGHTGARKTGAIGFSTIRGGDIAGEHSVLFIGDGERIEITHRATDRRIFADGAIKAAKWLSQQPPGLHTMRDVLGLD
ncbi:MAG: 4-hydroxy-tetrahydrodipicolinate reductase, partial [bacterium]